VNPERFETVNKGSLLVQAKKEDLVAKGQPIGKGKFSEGLGHFSENLHVGVNVALRAAAAIAPLRRARRTQGQRPSRPGRWTTSSRRWPCAANSAAARWARLPRPRLSRTAMHSDSSTRKLANAVCNFHSLTNEAKSNGRCP
jgi:hypothetical protein